MSLALDFAPQIVAARPVLGLQSGRPNHGEWQARVRTLHAPTAVRPLRLTVRGAVVLGVLVAGVAAVLVELAARSAPWGSGAPATGREAPVAFEQVTVRSGDTLWSIAARVAPTVDPRVEVGRLERLNGVGAAALQPGQVLRIG